MAINYDGAPGINGTLLNDSIAPPDGAAGDTNCNPDLGRRRPTTLITHFPNTPSISPQSKTSDVIRDDFWGDHRHTSNQRYAGAPDLNTVSAAVGLNHPMCPNMNPPQLGDDLVGTQTPSAIFTLTPTLGWPMMQPAAATPTGPSNAQNPSMVSMDRTHVKWIFSMSRHTRDYTV